MSTQSPSSSLRADLGAEHIRVVRPADAESLRENCLSQMSLDAVRDQISRDLEDYARGDVVPLVAAVEGAVIAMATLRRNTHHRSRHRAEISPVVVTGPYQRRGCARRLVEALRQRAATLGIDQLEISAAAGSPAEVVYRRLGFIEWGRLPNAGKDSSGKAGTLVYFSMPDVPSQPDAHATQGEGTSGFDLDRQRMLLLEHVLPEYTKLGALAFAHIQGSLVLGYTDVSDLDVILVWDTPEIPQGREPLVARLDERQREFPEVIDYRDIHIDRFVMGGQEYELAHYTVARFEQIMHSVRTGHDLPGREIVNPQALAGAFREAVFVLDPQSAGRRLQDTLREFPEHLEASTRLAVRNNRERRMNVLRTHARRGDWFPFYSALASATRTVLQALFAQREVYWTGDKWRRAAMLRYRFEPHLVGAYDRLWSPDVPPERRLAALDELTDAALVDAPRTPIERLEISR